MLGTDNLKKCVKFGIEIGEAVDASLADGHFSIADASNFFKPMMEVPSVVAAGKLAMPELKDLDAAEAKELVDYVTTELNIANDKAEAVIEKSLKVAAALYEIYLSVKESKTVAVVAAEATEPQA